MGLGCRRAGCRPGGEGEPGEFPKVVITRMITDPLFYRLFETSPETLFLVLGQSTESASETARRYQYEVLESKQTAHRTDGVFRPLEPGLPLYFVEVQFYRLPTVFAG